MEAKYYVAVKPRTNETHPIHKEGCPFLSDNEKRIFLGIFSSDHDALKVGRHHFLNSCRCPFCSKETETGENIALNYENADFHFISAEIQMPIVYQSSMVCGLN